MLHLLFGQTSWQRSSISSTAALVQLLLQSSPSDAQRKPQPLQMQFLRRKMSARRGKLCSFTGRELPPESSFSAGLPSTSSNRSLTHFSSFFPLESNFEPFSIRCVGPDPGVCVCV